MARKRTTNGLAVAEPPPGALEQLWVDPRSLHAHPLNWRTHDAAQLDVLGESLDEHGWLAPLLYNRRTGRLVNGHARKDRAIADGIPAVPVWVGEWDEAQEAAILATLDPSGEMAGRNAKKLAAVLEKLRETAPNLTALLDRLRGTIPPPPGTAPPPEPTGAVPGSSAERPFDTPEPPRPPPLVMNTPRMVQLYFHTDDYSEFYRLMDLLGERFGLDTPSDIVLRALADQAAGGEDERA